MLKLHHYEHNDNYLGLKPTPPTREKKSTYKTWFKKDMCTKPLPAKNKEP
jgi:hypothetical protein